MTTRQRLDLLASAHPRLFPRRGLLHLLRTELGHVDALDAWVRRSGDSTRVRAQAPRLIYHLCAGNLAVSAWTSLAQGLLLGAHNVVKLPSERDDSSAQREILDFIEALPEPLRPLVEVHPTLDPEILRRADVVVAFGSDATMQEIRAQTRWDQKFIAHGHALSLLWMADPNELTSAQARACAIDILTYDQLGCLSPQAIYLPTATDFGALSQKLCRALETHWRKLDPQPLRPLSVAARIVEARDLAHALGHRVWLPPNGHLGWTLIFDPDPTFRPSPLHGVIYLRPVDEAHIETALASVAGRISTVGIAGIGSKGKPSTGKLSSRLQTAFLNLGASRFCPAGHMQFPPLTWHHDGRASLGDLVRWIDAEPLA